MADYQRVVEFLRDVRQAPLQGVTEEISQAAKDFATFCVEANERLRKCSGFLQQGLRTEAIHLADENPNLLDLVAALDLPDPEVWAEFCANNGLPVPPPLQLDRAEQLNEAYAQDQPMEHLLSRHRLLALARAPMRERLGVMRQLMAIDPGNAAWEKDIRGYEAARIRELPTSFYNAMKDHDDAAIVDLAHEMTESAWIEPLPLDLVTAVTDANARIQRRTLEDELKKLVQPLRDAFAAQTLKDCQSIVARWKKLMTSAGVTNVSHELSDEIKPVIAWIAEEEKKEDRLRKYRGSCKAFGDLLNRDATDRELEAGYARLKEFGEPVPEDFTTRYADKRKSRQHATERKHKLRLAAIAGIVIVIVVVVLGVGITIMHASAAERWANELNSAVAAKDIEKIRHLLEELSKASAQITGDQRVSTARAEAMAKEAEYARDQDSLKDTLEKYDGLEKSAGPVAANTGASMDDLVNAAASLKEGLAAGRAKGDLSWVDTEKKLGAQEGRLVDLLARLQTRASSGVKARVDALAAEVDGLASLSSADASAKLLTIGRSLRAMKDLAGIDVDATTAIANLLQRADKMRETLEATRDITTELQSVRAAAISSDDLKRALEHFVQRFPNAPQTQEFSTAIQRMNLAKAVESWRDMAAGFGGRFGPSSQAGAQKRFDALAAHLTAYPDSPFISIATEYEDYLRRAIDALAEKGTWQTALTDLLSTPMVSELCYMESSDGKRYYVLGDIKMQIKRINNQVTVTFEALNPKDLSKRMIVNIDPPVRVLTDKPVRMPHAKVAADMADAIKLIDESNWDTWGIDMSDKLVKNTEMDIVVKAILLQPVLKANEQVAGWALGDTYSKAITELARQKAEEIQWIDADKVTDGMKKAFKSTMDNLPPAATVKQLLQSRKVALFKAVKIDIGGTGVLLRDDHGNWDVSARTGISDGNILWIVKPGTVPFTPAATVPPAVNLTDATSAAAAAPAAAAMPGIMVQIGVVKDGRIVVDESAIRDIPQGSMVFLMRP